MVYRSRQSTSAPQSNKECHVFLKWHIPNFPKYLLRGPTNDNSGQGNTEEKVAEIPSPNIAETHPTFDGVTGEWKTKKLHLTVKSMMEEGGNMRMRVDVTGEVLLDGPVQPDISRVHFYFGRRSLNAPVQPSKVVDDKSASGGRFTFAFKSLLFDMSRPLPVRAAAVRVVLSFKDACPTDEAFLSKAYQFYESKQFTDVVLLIGDDSVPAHKIVLAAASDVFKQYLSQDSVAVTGKCQMSEDIPPGAWKVILDYCYGKPLPTNLSEDRKRFLQKAMIELGLEETSGKETSGKETIAKELSGKVPTDTDTLTIENAVQQFLRAKKSGEEKQIAKVIDFVKMNEVGFAEAGGSAQVIEKCGKLIARDFFIRVASRMHK